MIEIPLFDNIFTALRVSYLMEILQRSVPNSVTIIQQMNYCYTYNRGNNKIHFDGLTDLEKHAQCALIRNIAEKQLPLLLSNIIIAKYSANDIVIKKFYKKNKIKIRNYQALTNKKIQAISEIAKEIHLIYFHEKNISLKLVEILTAYSFDKDLFAQRQISILQLANQFNIPKSSVYNHLKKVSEFIRKKETLAVSLLTEKFAQRQIIPTLNKT